MQVIEFFCVGHDEVSSPELACFFLGEWNSDRSEWTKAILETTEVCQHLRRCNWNCHDRWLLQPAWRLMRKIQFPREDKMPCLKDPGTRSASASYNRQRLAAKNPHPDQREAKEDALVQPCQTPLAQPIEREKRMTTGNDRNMAGAQTECKLLSQRRGSDNSGSARVAQGPRKRQHLPKLTTTASPVRNGFSTRRTAIAQTAAPKILGSGQRMLMS